MHKTRSETQKQSVKLTVKETAEFLNESERAIWMRVYRHQIPYRRWGKRVFILRDELEAFLRTLSGVSVEEATQKASER